MGDSASQLADSFHPLRFAKPLFGPDPICDVADRADDAVDPAGPALDRGQDGFPSPRSTRQTRDDVAREHRLARGAHPTVVVDGRRRSLWPHQVGYGASANLVGRDVDRSLERWIDVADHEAIVVGDLQNEKIVRAIGEDGVNQGVAGLSRRSRRRRLVHRRHQPAVAALEIEDRGQEADERQQGESEAHREVEPGDARGVGHTGLKQGALDRRHRCGVPRHGAQQGRPRTGQFKRERAFHVAARCKTHARFERGDAPADQAVQGGNPGGFVRIVAHKRRKAALRQRDRPHCGEIGGDEIGIARKKITSLARLR